MSTSNTAHFVWQVLKVTIVGHIVPCWSDAANQDGAEKPDSEDDPPISGDLLGPAIRNGFVHSLRGMGCGVVRLKGRQLNRGNVTRTPCPVGWVIAIPRCALNQKYPIFPFWIGILGTADHIFDGQGHRGRVDLSSLISVLVTGSRHIASILLD